MTPTEHAQRTGDCDCCGELKRLNLISTPLGHKTWECKECTAEWDGECEEGTP